MWILNKPVWVMIPPVSPTCCCYCPVGLTPLQSQRFWLGFGQGLSVWQDCSISWYRDNHQGSGRVAIRRSTQHGTVRWEQALKLSKVKSIKNEQGNNIYIYLLVNMPWWLLFLWPNSPCNSDISQNSLKCFIGVTFGIYMINRFYTPCDPISS